MTLKLEVMKLIGKQIDEILGENYEGQTVLVKFSGEIIGIFCHTVDALQWAQKLENKDFFVHTLKKKVTV